MSNQTHSFFSDFALEGGPTDGRKDFLTLFNLVTRHTLTSDTLPGRRMLEQKLIMKLRVDEKMISERRGFLCRIPGSAKEATDIGSQHGGGVV